MTLFLDDDYAWLGLMLRPECERRGIPFDMSDLNARSWGDALFITDSGTYSGEIKSGGELLGNLDHCEAQLQKQLESADRCFLAVYGKVEPVDDGNSYVFTLEASREKVIYQYGYDNGITRDYKRRYYRTSYLGYRTWLARLVSLGVDVYEVPSREALATQLIALYHTLTTEGSTLRRVIVEKPRVQGDYTPEKLRFVRTLMGIDGAGIAEERANAVADWLSRYFEMSLTALIEALQDEDQEGTLEVQPMPNGKQRYGPAAVQRLKEALGLSMLRGEK